MRKASQVQDFIQMRVNGTQVMREKSSFLGGKMMDIEDIINITYSYNKDNLNTTNLTEKQIQDLSKLINIPSNTINLTPTQITDLNNTITSLNDKTYDVIKRNSIISLKENNNQSTFESNTTTKWIFEFDSKYLLKEYLYSEIYTYGGIDSPFYNISNNNMKSNQMCYDYIEKNVLDRYKVKEFILWTEYYKLKLNEVPGSGTNPEFDPLIKLSYKKPVFSFRAIPDAEPEKNKETISFKEYNDGIYEIGYKQQLTSNEYTFIYYFDVIYEKI